MKPIRMVDLQSQYYNIKEEIDNSIAQVLESTAFIGGSFVKEFEKNLSDYLGNPHVISCGNGTDALQVALMALNLPPDSEIITPAFTFVATAEVVKLLGHRVVFADVLPDTFNMDPVKLESCITENTRAIIPVHLFGQCADMDAIMTLAAKYDLYVIEDTAQALGAVYSSGSGKKAKAGTIGHIGTTSFFPSKNLGAYGDGGAVFTRDQKLADTMREIVNHGMSKQYIYNRVGVNSRLDGLQAAILNVKLQYLDDYNKARRNAALKYNEAFRDLITVQTPVESAFSTHIYHQYTLKIKDKRDAVLQYLEKKNIPCKVYYPVPLHQHDTYKVDHHAFMTDLTITDQLAKEVISLPMHSELHDEQIALITKTLSEAISTC
jgi:UDP-2-acetamido-2-deoxy-ribo-hexuluronate aminotransferase